MSMRDLLLNYLHTLGIVCWDIKLENVMLKDVMSI